MKIGILTFHSANNYGAILQCYALYSYLRHLGHDCFVVDYRPNYFGLQPLDFRTLKCSNPIRFLLRCVYTLAVRPKHILRNYRFEQFIKNNLRIAPSSVLSDVDSDFDVFFYGSDQIWDWDICHGYDVNYFAGFPAAKKTNNIAYAASLGKIEIDCDKIDKLSSMLHNYTAISVREDILAEMVSGWGINNFTVLDPTLLFSEAFMPFQKNHALIKEDYVLVYEVAHCNYIMDFAREIAEQIKTKRIVRIEKDGTKSPSCFLNLFKNAKCIVTTSFHGVAFSIIYKKPFYSLNVGTFADIRSSSLLTKLKLQSRIFSQGDQVVYSDIDYSTPLTLLDALQQESKTFIDKSINS